MKKILIITTVLAFFASSCGPETVDPPVEPQEVQEMTLNFAPKFDGGSFELLSSTYTLASGEEVEFKRFAALFSNFYLINEDGSKLMLDDQYAFLNLNKNQMSVTLTEIPKGNYKGVGFMYGLDSAINHGPTNQYPIDHPLNTFNNSLYWDWAGGYIFSAIEGGVANSNEKFVFHLAGSMNTINYELPMVFTKDNKALQAEIDLHMDEIFKNPEVYSLENDGTSVHNALDAVTTKLIGNMGDIFSLMSVSE